MSEAAAVEQPTPQPLPGHPALEVRDLTGPARAAMIHDVRLTAARAATTVVLGPIHSGKTMLMRHLVGLEEAREGTIVVDNESFRARGESEVVVRRMRTKIGVVFQGAALISRLSALENVELPLLEHTNATPREAEEVARALLEEVGLRIDPDSMPMQLDRALQRRVALARALALRPPVLLLDEWTQGLDPHAAAELDDTLAVLRDAGKFGAVIFSHDVRYAFRWADYIYVMGGGSIIESGDRTAVQQSGNEVVRRLLGRRSSH